jgi:hypothetical protein
VRKKEWQLKREKAREKDSKEREGEGKERQLIRHR